MDLEVLDDYVVEHNDNFELTADQVRKLLEQKFARNVVMQRLYKPRERDIE